jgi:hypothetical protein
MIFCNLLAQTVHVEVEMENNDEHLFDQNVSIRLEIYLLVKTMKTVNSWKKL